MLHFELILQRLKELLGVKSDRQVALNLQTSPDTLNRWKKRNTIPIQILSDFATHHGCDLGWLLTGERSKSQTEKRAEEIMQQFDLNPEEFDEFFARIPIYVSTQESGEAGSDGLYKKETILFPVHFLHLVLNDIIDPSFLEAIYVTQDNMTPTLQKGSLCIVDNSYKRFEDGKVYVFIYEGDLHIRRVFIDSINKQILLTSDNERYPTLTIADMQRIGECEVIGQMIGYIGRMR